MSSFYNRLEGFLNNGKNFYKIFFFLVVFLSVTKLPSILTTDIQPWDEGMYAVRVLSVHVNGDFIDQSSHSVGRFYSGSHPPLLIWIGYFITLVFGTGSTVFKLITFTFSLLCILLIFLTGRKLFDQSTGFFAALIFSGNMMFNIFSKRFQFDIPYTFFILLSFYLMFLYNDSLKLKYLLLSAVSFGCCLMIKILVGFYIPLVLVISYVFARDKINFKLKDIVILTAAGVLLALPWHLHMLIKYGSEFWDYFIGFHVLNRVLSGVESNQKESGFFYYFYFLLSIIPLSALAFLSFLNDLKTRKSLSWKKIFLWVWFLTGLLIISLSKTKLEVYLFLILPPLCFLIPAFINGLDKDGLYLKTSAVFLTFVNIFFFGIKFSGLELRSLIFHSDKLISIAVIIASAAMLYFISRYSANKIELKKTYYIFIFIFFIAFNVYYAFRINEGETDFRLSGIKELIENSGKKNIVYVATNYRFNPQFSFYFKGLDLNWEDPEYRFTLIDTKDGIDKTKEYLTGLDRNDYFVIVEKDNINRAVYPESGQFIPGNYDLILKQEGYELYEN